MAVRAEAEPQGPVSLQAEHGPQVGDAGRGWHVYPCRWPGRGPRVPPADACRPLCIIQLVNCPGPVAAERAIEPRGVIIYDETQRCLPGTGMG